MIGGQNGSIQTFDTSGNQIQSFSAHSDAILALIYIADLNVVVSSSNDNTAKVWSTSSWTQIASVSHGGGVTSLAHLGGKFVASGSRDANVMKWSANTGEVIATLNMGTASGALAEVYSLLLLSNNNLAVGVFGGNILIYDSNNNNIMTLIKHSIGASDMTLISSSLMASGSFDSTIKIWNYLTGSCISTLTGHSGKVNKLRLTTSSLASSVLASASSDKKIKLWDLSSYTLMCTLNTSSNIQSIDVCTNQNISISGSMDQTIKIWNINSGEMLNSYTASIQITSLALIDSAGCSISSPTNSSGGGNSLFVKFK